MGKPHHRFAAKAEAGKGWRIWDSRMRKWWGEHYQQHPEQLLAELNGDKRPDRLNELIRKTPRKKA